MAQVILDAAAIAHETAIPLLSRAIPTFSSALPLSTSAPPPTGYRIHLLPLLDQSATYRFTALTRELRVSGDKLFVGRDKDRSDAGGDHELLFRSKVVSRAHAEIMLDGGRLFIKDMGSLHGTFLNQLRLSSARKVSRLRRLKDGDIVQLGADHRSGVLQDYKFVKAKVRMERIAGKRREFSISTVKRGHSTDRVYEDPAIFSPGSYSTTDSFLDLPATAPPSTNVEETMVNPGDICPTAYYKLCCVPDPKAPRALQFKPLTRVLSDGDVLRVARFTENSETGLTAANALDLDRLVFKTRVVSRAHAEVWMEDRTVFIKDIGSSSGTFLNGKRLSPADEESEAWPLRDGDLLQLGVEYCGGILDIHKPARIRVELCETTSPACDALERSSDYDASSINSLDLSGSGSVLDLAATVKPPQGDHSSRWISYGSVLDLRAAPNLRNWAAISGEKNTAEATGFLKRKLSMLSLPGWRQRRGKPCSRSHRDEKTKTKLGPKLEPTEVAAARFKERILARMSRKELFSRPASPCTTDDDDESEGEKVRSVQRRSVRSEDGTPCMDVFCFCMWRSKPSRRS